jgi:multicomponent K+:H+ antiporter subunit D
VTPSSHLIVAPVLVPLGAAALMLLLGQARRNLQAALNVAATIVMLALSIALLARANAGEPQAIGVYLVANWDVPFGIVLAADRLAALMLVLTALIALCALLYALARWQRAGVHFHPLFQLQLMGLNGAFLTADLFNLFVFFEVMLAASYGLLLHGSGAARVRAGLHYIAVNLVVSSLFLVGVAILYGITGTLNLADMASRVPLVAAADRGLLHAGVAILGLAFLVKAGMWPLDFWLAPAYAAASAPVAALFVILTKVGVYVVLRLWTLLLSAEAAASAGFGGDALVYGGLATLLFGAIAMLATQQVRRLAAFAILVSSGTMLAAIGFASPALVGAALFYLAGATLGGSALFLLADLVERTRRSDEAVPLHDDRSDHLPFHLERTERDADTNLDDAEEALFGQAIPAAMAFLGLCFVACAVLVAGLPPRSGFLAKLAMLRALLPDGARAGGPGAQEWALFALLIVSGLLATLALMRAGIRYFWTPPGRAAPRLRAIETLPIAALLGTAVALAALAGPALRYTSATSAGLFAPQQYVDSIRKATPRPGPTRLRPPLAELHP